MAIQKVSKILFNKKLIFVNKKLINNLQNRYNLKNNSNFTKRGESVTINTYDTE